jgi:hypothetical protein
MTTTQTPPPNPQAPGQQEPPNRRDAKADAKAAKAYYKAQRPWYKKKRWILALGLILLIAVTAVASGGGGDTSQQTADPPAATPQSEESSPESAQDQSGQASPEAAQEQSNGPTAKLPQADGDWRLDSVRIADDGFGDFGGTARITSTGATEGGTNLFTIAVFKGGQEVAALTGSADDVSPGDAETVQLISTDKFVPGPHEYDFQTDL